MGNSYSTFSAPTSDGSLSSDRRFELLSHELRRRVVAYLAEESSPVAVADLARRIATGDPACPGGVDDESPDAVHVSLYHCHVPKLADAGVVDHDRGRNTVEPGENFEWAAELCETIADADGPST